MDINTQQASWTALLQFGSDGFPRERLDTAGQHRQLQHRLADFIPPDCCRGWRGRSEDIQENEQHTECSRHRDYFKLGMILSSGCV
jgi:hypothetical protein